MLTQNEMIEKIKTIGQIEDKSEQLVELTRLNDEINSVYTELETVQSNLTTSEATVKQQTEDITRLQSYNMELFKRNSETKQEVTKGEVLEKPTGDTKEKRSFEDLFKN